MTSHILEAIHKANSPQIDVVNKIPRHFSLPDLEDINVPPTWETGKTRVQSYAFETRDGNSIPSILDGIRENLLY